MYQSLQVCRALASLLVLFGHVGGSIAADKYFGLKGYGVPFSFGHAGVEFFFVLSGFIITHVHSADFGHPERIGNYLRKRITRIYPAYFVVFAATFLLAMPFAEIWKTMLDDAGTVIISLLLLPQSLGDINDHIGAPVVGVAWSLEYEMVFYAFVACLVLNRWLAGLVITLFAVNFVGCHLGDACQFPRSFFAATWMPLFALGVATAYVTRHARIAKPLWLAAFGTAGFFTIGILEVVTHDAPFMHDPRLLYGLFSAATIIGLVSAENIGALTLKRSWMSLLGDASYALYLIHSPIVSVLCKALVAAGLRGPTGAAVSYLTIITFCIASSIVFHLYVERPLQRYLSRPSAASAPR